MVLTKLIVFEFQRELNVLDDEIITREWGGTNMSLINSVCGGGHSGTLILFNSQHIEVLDSYQDADGRVISVDIQIFKDRFHIVNAYFPNDSPGRKSFINLLYSFIVSKYPIIWAGDQNMVTDHINDRIPSNPYKDSHTTDLLRLHNTFGLQDTCRKLYPSQYFYTFCGNNGRKSRIDKILVSGRFQVKSYHQHDFSFSDHDLVEVSLGYQAQWSPGKGTWKNNPSIFLQDDFLKKFKELWIFLKGMRNNGTTTKWWLDVKYRTKNFLRDFEKKKKEK